jgi:hypothetical protein
MKMNKMKWTLTTLAASLLIMTAAVATQAVTSRAFVSSTGNDANAASNCPQATPCKTFAGAIGVVSVGGELLALDSSGYGPVTISQSITIGAAPGATAFIIVATGTNGIVVNPGANIAVTLRNLNINGQGTLNSIGVLQQSGNLIIEHCTFTQLGIGFKATGGAATLENCDIINNTVGARGEGQGPDQTPFGGLNPARVTVIRVSGSLISFNGTAFQMHNAGANAGGNPGTDDTRGGHCNSSNIFIRNENSVASNNILGNPIFVVVTGISELNTGCGGTGEIGAYGSQIQNQTNQANQ